MKKITYLLSAGLLFGFSVVTNAQQNARVQVIHNSGDISISTIDVYIAGLPTPVFADAPYRSCTEFKNVPAGIPLTIQLAPGDSSSAADSFYSQNITLEPGATYIAVATGTRTNNGYTPFKEFNVEILSTARENALQPGNTDILLFQGSTDLPVVNAVEPGVGSIVNNVPYGEFLGYLSRPTDDYEISVINSENNNVIGNYYAEFESLNLQGKAVTILGSGFLDPTANSNGEEFGLWMATPAGGALIDMSQQTASVNKNKLTGVSVYPNPAKSQITINVPSGSTTVKSVIYDMMGRQVATGNGATLTLSGLNGGMYILKTDIDGKIFEQKIIKN